MVSVSVKNFVMRNGERYCLLVESTSGLPLYYPTLYLTTQVRNKSLSVSAMETALLGIGVFLHFLIEQGIDIHGRFQNQVYLEPPDLDALRDFCQKRFRANKILKLSKKFSASKVRKETEYTRLTSIAAYVEWLASLLSISKDKHATLQIDKMVTGIKSRRPRRVNTDHNEVDKSLDEKQIELVFEVFRPESDLNPFKDHQVKIRNRLVFLMLYHLGLRAGELLNIRIRDFDFSNNQLIVARRPDEKDDPRTYQPLVKTLDRRLPLRETLAREIHEYIVKFRKAVPNANKHDFLLVAHKAGPTQGQPMSIVAYKKIIDAVRATAPDLYGFTGHQLRHTWNYNFSKHMDAMDQPPSAEKQEKIRSYLMGWKDGSGTAATYNKRFIKDKAHQLSLELQKDLMRMPERDFENGNETKCANQDKFKPTSVESGISL